MYFHLGVILPSSIQGPVVVEEKSVVSCGTLGIQLLVLVFVWLGGHIFPLPFVDRIFCLARDCHLFLYLFFTHFYQ